MQTVSVVSGNGNGNEAVGKMEIGTKSDYGYAVGGKWEGSHGNGSKWESKYCPRTPHSHRRQRHWNIGGRRSSAEECCHSKAVLFNCGIKHCTLGALQMKMTATCGIQKFR